MEQFAASSDVAAWQHEMARLDGDLASIEFARALHRDPLTNCHRPRASKQPGQSSDQDVACRERGARNAGVGSHFDRTKT